MEPAISVVMTVYNEQESFLREAIESILGQSFTDFELLIINDGSDRPQVQSILETYREKDARVRLHSNTQNQGLTASLNTALSLARAPYIARLDSDDTADASRLEKQWRFMEAHPTCALCGTWAYLIDESGRVTGHKKSPIHSTHIRRKLLFYNFFTHSSLFFRRDAALLLGGYNQAFKKAQDYDFILKISAAHPVAVLPEFLCSNRLHPKSLSSRSKKRQEWYALQARFNAVARYGYPKFDILKIIPGLLYFIFVPYALEKRLLRIFHEPT